MSITYRKTKMECGMTVRVEGTLSDLGIIELIGLRNLITCRM
jgi:hypothetical protein